MSSRAKPSTSTTSSNARPKPLRSRSRKRLDPPVRSALAVVFLGHLLIAQANDPEKKDLLGVWLFTEETYAASVAAMRAAAATPEAADKKVKPLASDLLGLVNKYTVEITATEIQTGDGRRVPCAVELRRMPTPEKSSSG